MSKQQTMTLVTLLLVFQAAWGWDGKGTASAPYLVQTTADWLSLCSTVSGGDDCRGKVFRMTADISADGTSVGTESTPFAGIFDGDGHTLDYSVSNTTERSAPFRWVEGATIRHLRTTGKITTSAMYAAGIVSLVRGDTPTTLYDCQSDMSIWGYGSAPDNAAHGGLVGAVASGGLTLENCLFNGYFNANNSAGMVGWTNVAITLDNCMVSPQIMSYSSSCHTFYRAAGGVKVSMNRCYYTLACEPQGAPRQGEGVLAKINMPEGCTYRMVSPPDVYFAGVPYWKSGAWVELNAPDDIPFDHWYTGVANGLYISDPWTRNGRHQIADVNGNPTIWIRTAMPAVPAGDTADRYGVKYLYLSRTNYHLYTSDEHCLSKGWYFKDDGYLYVSDGEGTEYYVTAVTGYDSGNSYFNRTMGGRWPWSEDQFAGTTVPVDLLGTFTSHTHLGVIAPRAFKGCGALRRLVFISDTGQDEFHHNDLGPDMEIGSEAFADCPNLDAVVMMYYNYTGNDHWDVVRPGQGVTVAADAFRGSPGARLLVDPAEYQAYLGSPLWTSHQQRIGLYVSAVPDMSVNGARYGYMRNSQGEAVKNDAEGHQALQQTLTLWNASYRNLAATSLLAEQDKKNIWYTQVVGADADYLRRNGGLMRIYNDPGSYYNYKTIAIAPNAFSGCKDLRAIEFWQTNGRSENSHTNLKMVIPNGAFAHCDSLRELRMYYYCQDGDDHWETLGPEDVIPGNNIFGTLDGSTPVTEEEYLASSVIPAGFRIVVSPERYQEFIDDPNWAPYTAYIDAADYEPSDWSPLNVGGLTYDYACKTANTAATNQVVTQNLSWWNVPVKVYEIMNLMQMAGSAWKMASNLASDDDFWYALKHIFTDPQTEKDKLYADLLKQNTELKEDLGVAKLMRVNLKPTYEAQIDKMLGEPADKWFLMTTEEGKAAQRAGLVRVTANNKAEWLEGAGDLLRSNEQLRVTTSQNLERSIVALHKNSLGPSTSDLKKAWSSFNTQLMRIAGVAAQDFALGGAYAAFRAVGSQMSEEQFQRGLVENIKANIHNVSYENTLIYTPDKKLVYHVYVTKPATANDSITIYNDIGQAYNYRTVGISRHAFQGNATLRAVGFAENAYAGSDSYVPLLLAIPDSAFAGCKRLERVSLTYKTRNGGYRSLGPENFILGGDSIFAGCDTTRLKIVIDADRKDDFLNDDAWKHYRRFFTYTDVTPETPYSEYGVNYALCYDNNTTQRVSRVSGHKIEHLTAVSPDDEFLNANQGSMALFNDIGSYNNYKLDQVRRRAFKGNGALRTVSFWDVEGGDAYTTLDMELGDSCFAGCTNLANIDMLYCVTDGDDHLELLRPSQVRAGKGMLDGTAAVIKMTQQQVPWFEADSAWSKYRDRFLPCLIQPADEGVRSALADMCYYTPCRTPYRWSQYIDLARIGGAGFHWLDGRFTTQKDKLMSFADFKRFEVVGLDYVGTEWFRDCHLLSNILLPSTLRTVGDRAFMNCGKLQEIELPAAVERIGARAFAGCTALTTVTVRATRPAQLGQDALPTNGGMSIYVPAGTEDDYRKAWPAYADYIVGTQGPTFSKVVTTTRKGELAEKLGLYAEISYTGPIDGDEMLCLHGNYAKYDSLTVSGPLDDLDLSVIRYLAGADSYHADSGNPTDGRLRYLDLSGADIREGSKYNYIYYGDDLYSGRYDIETDNELPLALFKNCQALETLILPRSVNRVRTQALQAPNLKRVAFTNSGELIYNNLYRGWVSSSSKLLEAPLEELVMLTGSPAQAAGDDPWGQTVKYVYTYPDQLADYSGHTDLTRVSQNICAPFDKSVMDALADKHHYFPSEYLALESVEQIFNQHTDITDLSGFWQFSRVKTLDETFHGCYHLRRITLPTSLREIGRWAFSNCLELDTIRIGADSVPLLARDAFADLPAHFRILVPRSHLKRYRQQWQQYADHIVTDDDASAQSDIVEVTVTEPNTLAKALGMEMDFKYDWTFGATMPRGMRGDYSTLRRLKVRGPISGGDLALLRHLAGYTPWADARNYLGHLEHLDLYDARLVATDYEVAPDKLTTQATIFNAGEDTSPHYVKTDNLLPKYAFLKCYALKTLILPKTCTEVSTRAMQECEDLETLVIGEHMEDFNWDALDDCASMVRLFILTPGKLSISSDFFIWRWLCNNYNPTFDAFYVRPSLYDDYARDANYTGSSWQRTGNISHGVFTDDAAFCTFAAHGAATTDDLAKVRSVDGWFYDRVGIRDLTPLMFTAVDTLHAADLRQVPTLEKIALPATLAHIGDGAFDRAGNLRYVNFMPCDTLADELREEGFTRLGIDRDRTLVYVPAKYGTPDMHNVVVAAQAGAEGLHAKAFHLEDGLDYCVPYAFTTEQVENTRTLGASAVPYTVCVPYRLDVPPYSRAYELSSREGSTLVFTEVKGQLEPLRPYLVKAEGSKRFQKDEVTLDTDIAQTIPASGGTTIGADDRAAGYTLRGTLEAVSNERAAELGAYILQGDGNWHPVGRQDDAQRQADIPAYRAYLLPGAYAARTVMATHLADDADGIDTISTVDADGTAHYYDLNGRQLGGKPAHGLYIYQGKKHINDKR